MLTLTRNNNKSVVSSVISLDNLRADFTVWTNSMLKPICGLAAAAESCLQSHGLVAKSRHRKWELRVCSVAVLR
jgi:hypothetical protein